MMEAAIVDRWGTPGAPMKQEAKIRERYNEYFASVAQYGITRANFVIAAREAITHCQEMIGEIRREPKPRKLKDGSVPKERRRPSPAHLSEIVGTIKTLLFDYGRMGWVLFWPSIRTLARKLGLKWRGAHPARAAWERVWMLERAGLLERWNRWRSDNVDHQAEEARSTVYFIKVPPRFFEIWTKTPEAQRLLASLARGEIIDEAAEPSPPSLPRSERRGAPPRSSPMPVPAPASSAADVAPATDQDADRWFLDVFRRLRLQKYGSAGSDTINPDPLRRVQEHFAVAAKALRKDVLEAANLRKLERGKYALPPVDQLKRELAEAAIGAWFTESGRDGFLKRQEHPIGTFLEDAPRLADAAREKWLAGWRGDPAHQPKESEEPKAGRPGGLEVARQFAAGSAAAAEPLPAVPNPYPPLRLVKSRDEEWRALQAEEAEQAARAALEAEQRAGEGEDDEEQRDRSNSPRSVDLDSELDTMESPIGPGPAPD